jgi:hypothetical protein
MLRDVLPVPSNNIHIGNEFVGLEAGRENDHVSCDEPFVSLNSL